MTSSKMEELLGAKEELGFWRGVLTYGSPGPDLTRQCKDRSSALRLEIEQLRKELGL